MLAAVTALAALATDYTGTLTVTVNGESTSTESTISIIQSGDDYTLSINNFVMGEIPVGNIVVTAPGTTSNGLTSIITSQDITITEGNNPNYNRGSVANQKIFIDNMYTISRVVIQGDYSFDLNFTL